jgi:hypothetical protein
MKSYIDRLKILINNPRFLLGLFVFLAIPVVVLLLSLLIAPRHPDRLRETVPAPTPIPLKIPENEEIPAPIFQMPPSLLINRLRDISFEFPDQTFPKVVKIYKAIPGAIDPLGAQKMAQALIFNNAPDKRITKTDTILTWKDGQRRLNVHLESGNIEYFNPQGLPVGPGTAPVRVYSPQEVMIAAQDFIRVFSPYSEGLSPSVQDISYYMSGPGAIEEVENFTDGDTFDVPFVQIINNLPIYSQFGSGARARVWFRQDAGVIKVTMRTNEALAAEGERQILTLGEAKRKIEDGEGVIVLYGGKYHGQALPPPTKTVFTHVKLAYFKDNITGFLYPIFIFSGTAAVEDKEERIVVYLLATK